MKINSLTIVGGGSAGWMTAALLSKYSDIKITLIESENIKTIGVGESTLQHFNRLVRRLDLTDREWMPKCKATYKTSIAFKNWRDGKGCNGCSWLWAVFKRKNDGNIRYNKSTCL